MRPLFVDPDITRARTPDKSIYTDTGLFNRIRERVFAASLQFAGDTDKLGEGPSACPVDLLPGLLDESLVFTRDGEGRMHCLSNVCTHRGNLLVTEPCRVPRLTCGYHGRRFGLDGTFQFMPEFEGVCDFPSPEDHLARVPWFRWGKWLFASAAPSWHPEEVLLPMMTRLRWLPVDDFVFRPDRSRDYVLEANWALYVENYLEGFHIPFVHAGLNEVLDYGTYSTELYDHCSLQLGLAKDGEPAFDLPAASPDAGKRVAAYYFWIFPNMMFNFYPWGLSVNVVKPVGIDRTVISFLTYVWNESRFDQGAGSDLHRVEMEDEAIVAAVQRGVKSRFYRHGRYSPTRETGTHHFHRLLCRALS